MRNVSMGLKLVRGAVLLNRVDFYLFNKRYEDCNYVIGLLINLFRSMRREVIEEKNMLAREPVTATTLSQRVPLPPLPEEE